MQDYILVAWYLLPLTIDRFRNSLTIHLVVSYLKKRIVLLWYHTMDSWECFACPIIGCPCKIIYWRQYLIHFACFSAKFVSVQPRMSILCSFSMFLRGSSMSCWRQNWNLTLSAWCHSTIEKQIRGVQAVHMEESTKVVDSKASKKWRYVFHKNWNNTKGIIN